MQEGRIIDLTIYRAIVVSTVKNGEPIISAVSAGWLKEKYPDRKSDEGIDSSYWAYSPDNQRCVTILFSKNLDMINRCVADFGLKIIDTNREADSMTKDWRKGNSKCEEMTQTMTTSRKIDNSTIEEITECCIGCKDNPYGKMPPTITRRNIEKKSPVPVNIKDVYVEESDDRILLTIENDDQSKKSAILKEKEYSVDPFPDIINTIKEMLNVCGARRVGIAEEYVKDRKNEDAFLHDLVAFAKYLSLLPPECQNLIKDIPDGKMLMHNRIIVQVLQKYQDRGYRINSNPNNFLNNKKHDFNIGNFRCEVKTIQALAKLERTNVGFRFEPSFAKTLAAGIKDDIDKAEEQVGNDGIIFLAPWSHKINGIFRAYFSSQLSSVPPDPAPNLIVLVLTSNKAFEDYYVSITTNQIRSELDQMIQLIQTNGTSSLSFAFIRQGLRLSMTTAPVAGSSVGVLYDPMKD